MADGGPAEKPQETTPPQEAAPKKKHKKKAHKSHKVHADHKVSMVEEPPAPTPEPPPAPTPEPPPVQTFEPPPLAVVVEKKDDSGFYIGGGAGGFMLDTTIQNANGLGGSIRLRDTEFGAYGNVGYNFNRNIALELRAGGIEQATQLQDGGPLFGVPGGIPFTFIADTDGFYSAFLKGTLPIGNSFGIYGLVGATHYVLDLAANIGPLTIREDFNDGDFSYGGGIEARVGKSLTLGAEYVAYIDDSDGGVAVQLDGAVGRVQFRF